jgi:hypothetical protein
MYEAGYADDEDRDEEQNNKEFSTPPLTVISSSLGNFADETSYHDLDVDNALTCHGDSINPISPINQGGLTAAYLVSYQTNPLLKISKENTPACNELPLGFEGHLLYWN